ncbi:MAG: trigger factor family protein, partial [Actinomycetota bacterium]|nr:trigger factor family protein [Actinomycetota bacterium]
MRSSVEPLEGNKVKLSVELDEAEFGSAIDAAFRKIAREIRIPGFRPGKAPRRLVEARIGLDVARQEAIREALPGYYERALRENDLEPIAAPEIDITSGDTDPTVAFDAVVEVMPSVDVAGYGGLRVV